MDFPANGRRSKRENRYAEDLQNRFIRGVLLMPISNDCLVFPEASILMQGLGKISFLRILVRDLGMREKITGTLSPIFLIEARKIKRVFIA